jgi:hypothetical protein
MYLLQTPSTSKTKKGSSQYSILALKHKKFTGQLERINKQKFKNQALIFEEILSMDVD